MSLSVITAVKNGAETIRACLESVRRQTVPSEHIVVDGASTDGTLDVVREHAQEGLVVVSEPDGGLYEAMSKGIRRATGEIVGTLNADDIYAGPRVLATVAAAFSDPAIDSAYGDLVYVRSSPRSGEAGKAALEQRDGEFCLPAEQVVRRWKAGEMSARGFHWGWMPPHPTFFVRRAVYERFGGFRFDLGTSADYELMLRLLLKQRVTTRYIPQVLVKMSMGGVSNASWRNRLAANRNDRKAWRVNGLRPYPWTLWAKPLRKVRQCL